MAEDKSKKVESESPPKSWSKSEEKTSSDAAPAAKTKAETPPTEDAAPPVPKHGKSEREFVQRQACRFAEIIFEHTSGIIKNAPSNNASIADRSVTQAIELLEALKRADCGP